MSTLRHPHRDRPQGGPQPSPGADPAVPELPATLPDPIPGEPLPPADFSAERETLLGRALWISLVGILLLLGALFADGSSGKANAAPPATGAHGDGFFAASADLGQALARARREGKRGVAVLYEMNGCSDCARLRATTFTDPGLRSAYRRDFVAVSVMADEPTPLTGLDGKRSTQAQFAAEQRVYALPTLVFYDLDGLPVARHVGSTLAVADWLRLARYVREAGYEEAPFSTWQPAASTGS